MATYRDEALVLRTHKLGEADRIITLLTRRHGKVRAVAKGVRRTSSKFGARLEPAGHIDVQLIEGRSLDIIGQAVSLHAYGERLAGDYGAWTAAQVMLETTDRLVTEEGEPAMTQFRLLQGALRVLGEGTVDGPRPATMILASYLLRALALAGYQVSLEHCARCGHSHSLNWFAPSAGGLVCVTCRPPGSAKPQPRTIQLLGELLAGEWAATRDAEPAQLREAEGLITAFVQWQLERGLRSIVHVDR